MIYLSKLKKCLKRDMMSLRYILTLNMQNFIMKSSTFHFGTVHFHFRDIKVSQQYRA